MPGKTPEDEGTDTAPGSGGHANADPNLQRLECGLKEAEALILRHPVSAVATALCMGLVIGLLIRR